MQVPLFQDYVLPLFYIAFSLVIKTRNMRGNISPITNLIRITSMHAVAKDLVQCNQLDLIVYLGLMVKSNNQN